MFLFYLIISPSAHYLSCIILHINSSSVSQAARRFSFWLKGGQSVCGLELLCAALCEKKTTGTVQTSCIFFLSHPLAIEIGGGRACSPPTFDVKKKKKMKTRLAV